MAGNYGACSSINLIAFLLEPFIAIVRFLRCLNSGVSIREESDSHESGSEMREQSSCRSHFGGPMATTHPEYSANKVRGGVVILRQPWQRVVFMVGLFGGVVLLALLGIFGI